MLAILAAVVALVGFILDGVGAHTNVWFSPTALMLLALALIALHLVAPKWPWTK